MSRSPSHSDSELQWGIDCEEFDDLESALQRLSLAKFPSSSSDKSGTTAATSTRTSGWLATGVFLAKTRKILQTLDVRSLKATRPFVKFRRIARAVLMMVKVCGICRDMVLDAIVKEDWYEMMKTSIADNEEVAQSRRARPFITFVAEGESQNLVQLTFDKSEFSREFKADYLLTDDVRRMLAIKPCFRTKDQQHELVRFMKRISKQFNAYPLDVQRRLASCMVYDRYLPKRVITKQGQTADGVYFVLSGLLMEKSERSHALRQLKPGERFGEEDLVCGCARRTTVLTKVTSEVVAVHRLDYRAIFNMADESNDPRYLDVCKHDIVFQHFPVKKLLENPGVWSLLSYKFGRLIVKDSNDMEWIYVVKSGEARVLKELTTRTIDLNVRHKQVQRKISNSDPVYNAKKMIKFVTGSEQLKLSRRTNGRFEQSRKHKRHLSAPAHRFRRPDSESDVISGGYSMPSTPFPRSDLNDDEVIQRQEMTSTDEEHRSLGEERDDDISNENILPKIEAVGRTTLTSAPSAESHSLDSIHSLASATNKRKLSNSPTQQGSYLRTGAGSTLSLARGRQEKHSKPRLMEVPPFVQLGSLHAGKVFGLRACLEDKERGQPVSLVSGGCEILQINKKFFMKHLDEAMLGLIRAHHKAYPSEEELIDRLDANLHWQQYKQATISDFYKKKGRRSRCATSVMS